MRTTVTLDSDVQQLIKKAMDERGLTFKETVNDAIRIGLSPRRTQPPSKTPTFAMGYDVTIAHDKALQLAGELEDAELVRKLQARR